MFQPGSKVSNAGSTIFGPFSSQIPAMPQSLPVTQQSQLPLSQVRQVQAAQSPIPSQLNTTSILQPNVGVGQSYSSQIPAPPRLDTPSTLQLPTNSGLPPAYSPRSQVFAPMTYSQVLPAQPPSNINLQSPRSIVQISQSQHQAIPSKIPSQVTLPPSQVMIPENPNIPRVKMTQSRTNANQFFQAPEPSPLPSSQVIPKHSAEQIIVNSGSNLFPVKNQSANDDLIRQLTKESDNVNDQNFQEIRIEKMDFGMKRT